MRKLRLMALSVALAHALATPATPLVLENNALRIEVDPQVFAVRFVGAPGGANFLDPQYLSDAQRQGTEWLDPGGLTTDLVPLEDKDPALRRGPAEVILQEPLRLILLGAESPAMGLRLKKEIRLDPREATAHYIVTALSSRADGPTVALRNTARLPLRSTVRVPRKDTPFAPIPPNDQVPWVLVKSVDFWLVPIPPTARVAPLVLGGMAHAVDVQTDAGVWTRRITRPPTEATRVPGGATALIVLDDTTRSYGASLQGEQALLTGATPLQLTEVWTLHPRGR